MENAGRVLSRQQLLDAVWGRDVFIDGRTVDVHVGRLRKALIRGADPDPIRTVRGAGYAFGDDSRSVAGCKLRYGRDVEVCLRAAGYRAQPAYPPPSR